jgi:SAM-dependent methyltransferase
MEVRKMNILKYLDFLRSPTNGSELSVDENGLVDKQGNRFDIKDDIPRFVEKINYADSFGYQWNIFDKVQLDRFSSHDLTSKRFYKNTRWDDPSLKGKNLLEVGSGAGRFTEVLLKTGVNLFTIDYSNAVEANWKNNKQNKEFFIAQADIYNLPFRKNSFDYVFCFGVLQHTRSET